MEALVDFALQERYKQVKNLGDQLGELAILIEWEPFREGFTPPSPNPGHFPTSIFTLVRPLYHC